MAKDGGRFVGSPAAAALLGAVILITHGFGSGLIPALLPQIVDSFQSGYGVLSLALTAGMAAYGLGAALAVKVVDIVPPRGLLMLCLAVCAAAFLSASAASSPGMLAACTAAIGLSAPISWSAAVHIAGEAVDPRHHGRVLAVASAGTGVGYGLNGVFVQILAGPEEWRTAFAAASVVSVCTIAGVLLVFRRPIEMPFQTVKVERGRGVWRRIWMVPGGRAVILMSVVSGAGGLTFATYLSEVAVDELAASPAAAAAPWWLASAVGVAAALPLGLMGDRGSPVRVVSVMVGAYAALLGVLSLWWSYPALMAAAFGYGVLNFPVWGLIGLAAHRSLPPRLAVRAVSGGLAAAAGAAALSITASGAWIDRTGSFRVPAAVLAVLVAVAALWFGAWRRAPSQDREAFAEAVDALWIGDEPPAGAGSPTTPSAEPEGTR